jgi:hypothetical protein
MKILKWDFEAFIMDVNQENSKFLRIIEKILDKMFLLIKWSGIPFLLYLLIEIFRW